MFIDPQGDVLTNTAMFVEDGTTFEISYVGNTDSQDVTLTAVVPEPAGWALTVMGSVALLGGCRRRHACRRRARRALRPTNKLRTAVYGRAALCRGLSSLDAQQRVPTREERQRSFPTSWRIGSSVRVSVPGGDVGWWPPMV